ncbi:hypothetical protein ALP60_200110 [Pseudomonas savastanoi]|uniref:Uncharacterized protein n=1 Tax=Pseudomonas savastanoi TaxID=29438 RepID=A0A3M5GLW2_PSESS|nr:hypothetical protein ALP60_200110 [Pseudomonas savastanoi]
MIQLSNTYRQRMQKLSSMKALRYRCDDRVSKGLENSLFSQAVSGRLKCFFTGNKKGHSFE